MPSPPTSRSPTVAHSEWRRASTGSPGSRTQRAPRSSLRKSPEPTVATKSLGIRRGHASTRRPRCPSLGRPHAGPRAREWYPPRVRQRWLLVVLGPAVLFLLGSIAAMLFLPHPVPRNATPT